MPDDQRFGRYQLLASAIAGRVVDVASVDSGVPSWTDGTTIFVAVDLAPRDVVRSIAVQACLLAARSFEPEVLTRLERSSALIPRYLAIEGHRALGAYDNLLPPAARSLIDAALAASTSSAVESLRDAERDASVAAPPPIFGTIRPRELRKKSVLSARRADAQVAAARSPVNGMAAADAEPEPGSAFEFSSAWVGRGGAIGRVLKKLLADARTGGSGPPGSDAMPRWSHRWTRRSAPGAPSIRSASGSESAEFFAGRSNTYPEWDVSRASYRADWCTVVEVEAARQPDETPVFADARALRRPLARVGLELERRHRQLQGDDVDIDAAVEQFAAQAAGTAPDEARYIDSVRRARDLAVLVLLDVSGSAGERSATGPTVHEHQRQAAAALTSALHDLGDRVALYGFRSLGRNAVHVVPVKRFDDKLDARVSRRLGALTPGAYTRLGAAIRHGAATLEMHGGTRRRLLVVISDGFAYDHGYEGDYGEADARRALTEARHRGIGCLCLSIGAATEPDALRRVFGTAAHASLSRTEELAAVVGPLFQSALRSAESQQRRWQRAERTRERLTIDRRTA